MKEAKRIDKVMALRSWASGRSTPNVRSIENHVFNGSLVKPKRERLRAKDIPKLLDESIERNLQVASKMAKRYPDKAANKLAMVKQMDTPSLRKLTPKELREKRRADVKYARSI